MDTHREVYGLSNIEDEVVIIKNNIYINSKFVDKFNNEIINILYQKKKIKLLYYQKIP